MESAGNPKAWVPYVNSKDCSQGFCSLYCPQWCYIIFSPPPPVEFPDENSSPSLSPLVIAIIGILASAFLLVSYYTIISKYCGNSSRRENHDPTEEMEGNHNQSLHEPWQAATTGLDEALIKSITICKYKKGDGLIEGTDCSVCLSEFQEDESLRLLPKCSHAFHVPCIDTWFKTHSNCPLCRANVFFISASPSPLAPLVTDGSRGSESSVTDGQQINNNTAAVEAIERVAMQGTMNMSNDVGPLPKTPLRAFSDLGNFDSRDIIIEIRDEGCQNFRRSISMDHSCQASLSVADILLINQDEDIQVEQCTGGAGSSKQTAREACKSSHRRVLHCVMSPVAPKRSFSSRRFLLAGQGKL